MTRQRVRPTTFDSYDRAVRNHLDPGLGSIELRKLNRATVAVWVSSLQSKGLAAKTVRNVHGVLTKALEDGVELGLVATNVAHKLRHLPSLPSSTPRAWSITQAARFVEHVRRDRWFTMWRYFAVTGCRRGEVLGLRWSDLDLDAGTVVVRNQRTIAGGSVVEGPPKTKHGFRTLALDGQTVAELRSWRRQQTEERLACGAGWHAGDYVFCWQDGSSIWPQAPTDWFRAHCDELGLPQIGPHGLRHTAGTWMIARGENPKLVAQRLGHSHVSITLGLYAHVLPGHDQAAVDALGAALDAGASASTPAAAGEVSTAPAEARRFLP
jgi:integrase